MSQQKKDVEYHAGWCLVAVRQTLRKQHTNPASQKLLEELAQYGSDVKIPADTKPFKAFYHMTDATDFEGFEDMETAQQTEAHKHQYKQPPPAAKPGSEKHLLTIAKPFLPFFQLLHSLVKDSFCSIVLHHRASALVKQEEMLKAHKRLQNEYNKALAAVDAEDDGPLLQLVIKISIKSKQKRELKKHNVSGKHASRSLRSSLRKERKGRSRPSVKLEPLRNANQARNVTQALEILTQVTPKQPQASLHILTVEELKMILRHQQLRLTGGKTALAARMEQELLR